MSNRWTFSVLSGNAKHKATGKPGTLFLPCSKPWLTLHKKKKKKFKIAGWFSQEGETW